MSPALFAVSVPSAAMVPALVEVQVMAPKCSGLPSESCGMALNCTVEPTRTSAGFGVTSQVATWLAAGAVWHLPFRHELLPPHSVSLPQAGARQTPSSQTLV